MEFTEDEIVSKLIKLHNDLSYDDSHITDSSGEITIEILKDFIKDVKILENQEKLEILSKVPQANYEKTMIISKLTEQIKPLNEELKHAIDCYFTVDSILTKLNEILVRNQIIKDGKRVGFTDITGNELLEILSYSVPLDGPKRNEWEKKLLEAKKK